MKKEDNRETQNVTKKINKDIKGGTEAMVKGWELNNFVMHLSQI